LLILASGLIGVLGQIFITYGYKYISARAGSLISISRILYAVILGIIVFSEEITLRIAAGGLLIMLSIIAVSFFNQPKTEL
jgi:drug/metabolite transporter (DMT)-like permease